MATILVVDDDRDIRNLVSETLRLAGHDPVEAADGEEALAKIKKRRYDLILLDIMMPGVSGYDVLERLKDIPSRSDIPVIVLTAKHEPAGVLREAGGGAVDHVTKPFLPQELEEAVERALGPPEEREHRRQVLVQEAEVHAAMNELYESVRESEEADKKKQ